jgi:hypothetical protein
MFYYARWLMLGNENDGGGKAEDKSPLLTNQAVTFHATATSNISTQTLFLHVRLSW